LRRRLDLTHHDGEVSERLLNGSDMAATARLVALDHQRLADMSLDDDEIVDVEIVIVLGIGDRRCACAKIRGRRAPSRPSCRG
jgi:hypothetical protein